MASPGAHYVLDISFEAENDLSSYQYYFVKLGTGANQVDVCNAATDQVIGVLQNKPKAGKAAQVRIYGVSKVKASAEISKGAKVGTTASGTAVAKTADGDLVAGIALTAASAAGDTMEILLTPGAQRAS